jgi:phytanoyl-CoA hydroxylase
MSAHNFPELGGLDGVRSRAIEQLKELSTVAERHSGPISSWIDPAVTYQAGDPGIDSRRAHFDLHGFVIIRGFWSAAGCDQQIAKMHELIDGWDPQKENPATFRTDEKQSDAQGSSDYFLDSADRIHFFAEVDAVGKDGTLRSDVTKATALNKVGHGVHMKEPVFSQYCNSPQMVEMVHSLGWRDPVVPQSMYIFKQPRIGGEVTSHQDSTFLYTTPRQSCLGLWLALQPATLLNGCLWVRPGSHRESVRRAFCRNPAYFEHGDTSAPQMIFESEPVTPTSNTVPWEGKLPEGSWPPPCDGLVGAGFVPVECDAGDLVVFPGTLDHLSLPNYSGASRHTFQLHLVEGPKQGIEWSPRNWLQYKPGSAFHRLNSAK